MYHESYQPLHASAQLALRCEKVSVYVSQTQLLHKYLRFGISKYRPIVLANFLRMCTCNFSMCIVLVLVVVVAVVVVVVLEVVELEVEVVVIVVVIVIVVLAVAVDVVG